MIRNKVLGSFAPHAVFVFGGSGAPCLPMLSRPQGWWVATPPQWEVVRGGGAEGLWLTGFPLDPVRPSPRPHVLGLAWATGPASPSHHGVSAPAPLSVGSGHRFRGSLPGRVGVPGPCQRAPSLGSLALLSEFQ